MATYHSPITYHVDRKIAWPLIASGLWLRLGFIGAYSTMASIALMFTGGTGPLVALALALASGALTAYSCRRALTVLARDDTPGIAGGESAPVSARRTDEERLSLSLSPLHR
jgi:hypothetical protein